MTYSTEVVIAERTWSKKLPKHHPMGDGRYTHTLTATAKLYQLGGNPRPHFSLTGEVVTSQRRNDPMVTGGCIHDEIVKAWPHLAPLAAIHLSDDDGVPMHAVANTAYWFGFTDYKEASVRLPDGTCVQNHPLPYFPYVANLWRITEEEAREAHDWCTHPDNIATYGNERSCVEVLAAILLPKWKQEAEEAVRIINEG